MPTRTARTAWNGSLQEGSGQVELSSSKVGTYEVSFPKRAAEDAGGTTSPEELIAAAHSACFAMALSNAIAQAGGTPQSLEVKADVSFGPDKDNGGFRSPASSSPSRARSTASTRTASRRRPTRPRSAARSARPSPASRSALQASLAAEPDGPRRRPPHQPSSLRRASPIPKWCPTSWTTVLRTCSTTCSSVSQIRQIGSR